VETAGLRTFCITAIASCLSPARSVLAELIHESPSVHSLQYFPFVVVPSKATKRGILVIVSGLENESTLKTPSKYGEPKREGKWAEFSFAPHKYMPRILDIVSGPENKST
jgi:nitroreductase